MNCYCDHFTCIFLILFIIAPPITGGSCPPDVPLVTCTNAATACEEEICPNFRNARCVFDNCGGCNTKFFVGQTEVTDRCGRGE